MTEHQVSQGEISFTDRAIALVEDAEGTYRAEWSECSKKMVDLARDADAEIKPRVQVTPLLPCSAKEVRQIADALEALTKWMYAGDMIGHLRLGVPPKHHFDPSYVVDINIIRRGVGIAKKQLGTRFKALDMP